MTEQSDVRVRLDERIRLISALLAATDWPDRAQARKPHGSHAHARATRKHVAGLRAQPAVVTLQALLDRGAPLEAVFSLAMQLEWPGLTPAKLPSWTPVTFPDELRAFHNDARLSEWFASEADAWQRGVDEAARMLAQSRFRTFLASFFGSLAESLAFMPNIGYPADIETGVRTGHELLAIIPPRLAWGDSAPWPFDDDPVYLHRAALAQYVRLLLGPYLRRHASALAQAEQTALPVPAEYVARYPSWQAQFANLLTSGLVAIYLEDNMSTAEARGYVLIERKAYGVALLPSVVSVLRRYLDGVGAGRYADFADFLPLFPKQLRVAKRIVSL